VSDWIGLTVAQVMAICGVTYDELQLDDEPPGKLRAVELTCREGGQPRHVVLELEYSAALFSADRSWPRELVESQKVIAVHESSVGFP
jgi:hypothetical protein